MIRLLLSFAIGMATMCELAYAEPHAWVFISHLKQRKIATYERDLRTGQLHYRSQVTCPAEPAIMATSPDGRTLLVSFRSTGQLASFRIDPRDGTLTRLSVSAGGADPAYLQPDRTGRFLLTAYYVANKVTVHQVAADGRIAAEPLQTVPTAPRAHGIAIDHDNRLAFVTHTGGNRIYQFHFSSTDGRLIPAATPFVTAAPGAHPRHIMLHPTDRWAYINNEAGDSLSVYRVNPRSVMLTHEQTVSTIPDDFDGQNNSTARCEITSDGRFVYVANRGHDSIAGFAVDEQTGHVRSLGQFPSEKTPRSLTIDPSARFLYAAGEASGRVAAYTIGEEGVLRRFATYDVGPVPWCVLAVDTP